MPTSTKPIIGLAGGVGSGKSTVAGMLADLGCVVTDSDAAARAALRDPATRQRVVDEFGERVLNASGEVDRHALAVIVFNDEERRKTLESIVHPWIEQRRLEQFASAPDATPALVIDAPLLFEAGLNRKCDAVIFVDTPRPQRLSRVGQSRGWDEAELNRREAAQMPLDEKARLADHVLVNRGSLEELDQQVREILATIIESRRNP